MRFSLAVPDWQDRIRNGLSLVPPVAINPAEQRRAVKLFERLRLPDVTGQPALETACGAWFKEIVGALLGSIDPETGARLIRGLFLLAPKKSSKTTYGAGMMMTALLMNERPSAEFLLTGPTHDISQIAYDAAVGMIEADDDWSRQQKGKEGYLKTALHARDHLKSIEHRTTGASLKIKTFDMDVATGVKPVGVLVDELHVIAKDKNAARVLGQLRGGRISNPEAFFAIITTQSDEPPVGVMLTELQKARDIRDGKVRGDTLSVLYEFPPEIVKRPPPGTQPAWYNSALWPMVTPNLNRSVTIGVLEKEFDEARQSGETEIRRWASQHLNIEIGLNLRSDRWAGADYWEVCGDPDLTLEEIRKRSEICAVGIDAGGLDDLLGLAVLGRERETRRWLHYGHVWAHVGVFERRKDIASTLRDFEDAGDLTVVEDQDEAVAEIAAIINELDASGVLPDEKDRPAIGVDRLGQPGLIDGLTSRGVAEHRIGGVSQGFYLNSSIVDTEVRVRDRKLVHGASAMMAWTVGNARIERRGNAVIVTKQASGSAKIDALVALFNAAKAMGLNPESGPSVFDLPDDADTEQSDAAAMLSDGEQAQILADPTHPRWEEARRAWEDQHLSQDDD